MENAQASSVSSEPSVSASAVNPRFQRLALLTGSGALERLAHTRVVIFGVGGVGSWAAEALARSGVGTIALVDSDSVCITNINRQVQATEATVGRIKVDALKERLLQINPACTITAHAAVFSKETAHLFDIASYNFVIDAIDSVTHKADLLEYCVTLPETQRPAVFSSMGMAQKLNPLLLKTADIWDTHGCPLARLMRQLLKKRGLTDKHFTVVYSAERLPLHTDIAYSCGKGNCLCPKTENGTKEWCSSKKVINGSSVTVTATAGMILASLVLAASVQHEFA
ncbi:MAG: tRNA threonylcarbamoyladenosine dehydratase [Treponemataceae bacterium]|nr:MAG: tRNA threonylcarbamoyladenosine dehydratase [Treponemataceae bacterium]